MLVDESVGCLEFEVKNGGLRVSGGDPVPEQVAEQKCPVELTLEIPGLANAVESLHQAGM